MGHTPSLGTELWRKIVEAFNQGVIVISPHGVVIYANDEAARLLDYPPRDVIDLDVEDLIALCQPDRLDVASLATALHQNLPTDRPDQAFQVVTFSRRLLLSPFELEMPIGRVIVILLREDEHWRSTLIAHTVMDEMHSPLVFASGYCDTLLKRIDERNAYPEELAQLARVVLNGIERAQALWSTLHRLYSTDPRLAPPPPMEPIPLGQALHNAVAEIKGLALHDLPTLQLDLPSDLPTVCASPEHLHAALCSLLEEAMSRVAPKETLVITASDRQDYLRVDLTLGISGGMVRNYLFDGMPLSIVEQVIIQHGGRIWVDSQPGRPTIFSFSLPVWKEEGTVGDRNKHNT